MSRKKETPVVSVVVPIYNVEKYLTACIQSLVKQSYSNLQIVLVDDGSTDNSGKICDDFAVLNDNIFVIHKENGGVVSARKAGLEVAKGKYIGFVDGDDYIEPDMMEKLLRKLEEDKSDFVHSGYFKDQGKNIYGVETEGIYSVTVENIVDIVSEMVFLSVSTQHISPSMWSKLYKREIILDVHEKIPNDLVYGEDLLCLCYCILECRRISVMNQAFYHYVSREDSVCHERKMTNITRVFQLYHCLSELFQHYSLYPEMKEYIDRFFLRGLGESLQNVTGIPMSQYRFPELEMLYGKKIALFGAGKVGQDYYRQISCYSECEIVVWTDTFYEQYNFDFRKVVSMKEIKKYDFDVVLISVLNKPTAVEIKKKLVEIGVAIEKIIWRRPESLI